MKLIKESIDYEVYNPNEEEIEKFIDAHIPPCNSIALRISELFPGKKPSLELELAIQQKIKEDIISTLQEFSIPEVEAINYLEVVLEEMKESIADKLVDVVVEEEPAILESVTTIDNLPHLKDVLKDIKMIYVFDDINHAHSLQGLSEDLEESSEEDLFDWPDDLLLKMPDEDIHSWKSFELLDRMCRLDKSKLSPDQLLYLRNAYSQKYLLEADDVKALLSKLENCKLLHIAERLKNTALIAKHDLTAEDCLDVIKQLKLQDYVSSTRSVVYSFLGNSLIIFEPTGVKTSSGKDLGDLTLYIKLDLDASDGEAVVAISFHEALKKDSGPYAEPQAAKIDTIEDSKEEPIEETSVELIEEAVQVKYFRITYKHETGIYSTATIEADTYDKAVEEFNKSGKGELIDCSPISEEEFKDLIDSGIPEIGKEDLTEDLNVNVDTDQSNINVSAEEDAAVEIKVDPKNCTGEECDAEAELAELAKDPKYAKAFAYLMSTLQGEDEAVTEPATEVAEEPVMEEPLTEAVKEELPTEEAVKEVEIPAEEPPKEPEDLYVANTLNDLIKGELDTINQYNDLILGIQGMTEAPKDEAGNPNPDFVPAFCPERAAEIKEVVKDILVEENKHIGQLQELLKKVSPNAENIEAGVEKAKEQTVEASEEVAE